MLPPDRQPIDQLASTSARGDDQSQDASFMHKDECGKDLAFLDADI
jgi:hypothetical protein